MNRYQAFVIFAAVGCTPDLKESEVKHDILACQENPTNPCCPGSPIIIDMEGDGFDLTSAEDGVIFNLKPEHPGQWAWTEEGGDDAFLALDLNNNGTIDDGSELFGENSPQADSDERNGFAALAWYDAAENGGNQDGRIDAQDGVWTRLILWRDTNHDGWSDSSEMSTLISSGISRLNLNYTRSTHVDEHGNEFRLVATIVADAPVARVAADVWLVQTAIQTIPDGDGEIGVLSDQWVCTAWIYALDFPWATAPCNISTVQNDVIAGALNNVLARRVVRITSRAQRHLARNAAVEAVFRALHPEAGNPQSSNRCGIGAAHPLIDILPPPYEDDGSPSAALPRVKCTFVPDPTPPSGGCFADPPNVASEASK